MAQVFNDTFADTAGVSLGSHTSDSGHTWALHPNYSAGTGHIVISNSNRIRHLTTGSPATSAYVSSLTPASAEFDITFDMVVLTNVGSCGVVFRYGTAADNGYLFRISGTAWAILRADAGVFTGVGTANTFSPVNGTTYAMKIECHNASKRVLRNGVEITSTTDNTHTSAGALGVRFTNVSMTDTTGIHIDNLVLDDLSVVGNTYTKTGLAAVY